METGRLVGPDAERTRFEEVADLLLAHYELNGRRSEARVKIALGHLESFFTFAGYRTSRATASVPIYGIVKTPRPRPRQVAMSLPCFAARSRVSCTTSDARPFAISNARAFRVRPPKKLTGHKTEGVYRRYAITSAADLSERVAKLAVRHDATASLRMVLPFATSTKRAQSAG